jgi:hypothetical protein
MGLGTYSKVFLALVKNVSTSEDQEERTQVILRGFFSGSLGHKFTQFTKTALCSENMEFLEDVYVYREKFETRSDVEKRQAAAAIARKYISSKGPKQVNLPDKERNDLLLTILAGNQFPAQISKTVFNQAVNSIFNLLRDEQYKYFVAKQE